MNKQTSDRLYAIVQLRNNGESAKALAAAVELIREQPQEPVVFTELIRNFILNKYFDQVLQIFKNAPQSFTREILGDLYDAIMARMIIAFPQESFSSGQFLKRIQDSHWLNTFLKNNGERPLPLNIITVTIREKHQAPVYEMYTNCTSCERNHTVKIFKTPMIRRTLFCPHCLALCFIDYYGIKSAVQSAFASYSPEVMKQLDDSMFRLRENVFAGADMNSGIPLLCRYLNVDYFYTQTQYLLRNMQYSLKTS
ncbi:MAG TPA: hypothetical protein VEC36_08290 [Patescibacteria group bacterium]|nr:hypothetical protein [Patescibacteria group bacterium]